MSKGLRFVRNIDVWTRVTARSLERVAATGMLTCALVATSPAFAQQTDSTPHEGSVLISIRNASSEDSATSATTSSDLGLQPISQTPERTPDLAEVEAPDEGWRPNHWQSNGQSAASTTQSAHSDALPVSAAAPVDESSQFSAALAEVARKQSAKIASSIAAREEIRPITASVREPIPYEPARFNSIQPGTSTKDDLASAWGEPSRSEITDEGVILLYDIEPFQSVEVLVSSESVVLAIKVALSGGLEPQQLIEQLNLGEFEPVTITDNRQRALGMFIPERGVVFMFDGPTDVQSGEQPLVAQVAVQTLDANAFALRAENRLHGPYEKNTRDLKTAIAIDPEFTHARWLLSEVYLATGQADLAEAEAAAALEIDPENPALQLRHGQALFQLGDYDNAAVTIRGVLDRYDCSPVFRAEAMHELSRLASIGDAEIAAKAISFDTRAIDIADQLANSGDVKERRAAKRLLVDAHLAIAEEISRQSFAGKVDSLSEWVGRASGIAEDYIANEDGSVELRLIVAQHALAAMASFKPTLDPSPWVAEAEEAAATLRKQDDDPLWQQKISWEMGQVYLHALRTAHLRRETNVALKYGQLAIESLAEGASGRQATHGAEQVVGQLYFHVGAVYAVHEQDHKKAVAWYDKAVPILVGARPDSELYSPRRDGEMLVSMGVSYWEVGEKDRALDLTEAGARLVEAAVDDGILSKSSLAVPYGNLASMYQQTGATTNSTKYANLAKSVGGTPTQASAKPAAQRATRATASQSNRTGMIQTGGQQSRVTPVR